MLVIPLSSVLWQSVIYSLVLSLILNISQLYNPRIWLQDYPKDIREKVPPKNKREKMLSLYFGIPFLIFMVFYPPMVTYYFSGVTNYLEIFFNMLIIYTSFNIFDLVVLDWLLFNYLNPKYLIIPGTAGMKSYQNYLFHLRGLYIGLILSVIISALFSGVLILLI